MPVNITNSEFYRREAERLRTMAQSDLFKDVAAELVRVAADYERLAQQARSLETWPAGDSGHGYPVPE
jgi:hypothetical protein